MSNALDDSSLRHLVQFVERYSQGPACLVVECHDTTGPVQVRAHNKAFNSQHVVSLQQAARLGKLLSSQTETIAETDWTFTQLDEGVVVCIGNKRLLGSEDSTNSTSSAEEGRHVGWEKTKTKSQDGEEWFKYWAGLEVPGISREDLDAHLEILRNIDFAATPLGSIDTWSSELLSAFTQCLASPHAVCMAWGEKDRIFLYNQPYSVIIGPNKHPRILGIPYLVAFEEALDVATAFSNEGFKGRTTAVKNGIVYLQRSDYTEETYFSWSMVPIVHAPTKEVLGIHMAVFDAASVITDRRMKFLRQARQAIDLTSTPTSIFRRTCEEARESVDLPLLVFYECDNDENVGFHLDNTGTASQYAGGAGSPAVQANAAPRAYGSKVYTRSALTGTEASSPLFLPEINLQCEDSASSLVKYFRQVQQTHKRVLIRGEELLEFLPYLEKTALDDALTCIVLFPIVTGDSVLRAVAVAGLNPRKQYDEDYQLFLQLLQGQITHSIASVRLIQEKLNRSAFLADLTARKNEELRSALEARTVQLQQSEEQFRSVLEKSPVAICTLNPQGRFTWANPSWWRITGHPTDEPPDNWPRHINEEDLHIPQKLLAQSLDLTQTIEAVEFRWKRKPGEEFDHWTWADLSRNLDENGNIKEVIAVLIDHTDKKILEKMLETRAEEAIERRTAQEGFIDMVSHEVRNPLSAIMLSADASVERLESLQKLPPGDIRAHQRYITEILANLKIISHCCMHITRLIDDILTLSKLDNQFLVATPVPCRPVDFITETFSIFKAEMLTKDITSTLDIRPSLTALEAEYVLTDPSRINQLLINLTTNAIKFTAPSEIRQITVTLDCSPTRPILSGAPTREERRSTFATEPEAPQDKLYLILSISDTGCGLNQEEIRGLFQRFKQANPRTHIKYGGSGLGLFVCRRIVALLGGEIGVTSRVGKGSVFSFYVPVTRLSTPAPAPPIPQIAARPEVLRRLSSGRGSTERGSGTEADFSISVLIVEDNLINQQLLSKHLIRMGCTTTCANNGQEALDTIKQSEWGTADGKRIDIVLMDIEMPVMSGLEAIKEIRRLQSEGMLQGRIPVLAVTANARPEQIANMLASGFDGTVSKPFKMPAIMERMRKELNRSART